MPEYDMEEERIVEEIAKRGAARVLLQLPDGLKRFGVSISRKIEEKTQSTVFLSADSCYGGCDIPLCAMKALDVDLLVHYGHTRFRSDFSMSSVFVNAESTLPISNMIPSIATRLGGFEKITVATTIQHVHALPRVVKALRKRGFKVQVASGRKRQLLEGQIIGCDYRPLKESTDADAFLIIGSVFHGLGASLSVNRPVILSNPYSFEVTSMETLRKRKLMQRYAEITHAAECREFGVIVCSKPGQCNLELAFRMRDLLRRKDKATSLIVANEIGPEIPPNFATIDAFVNTGCPRLSIDDPERFDRPMLLPQEALVALGETRWEKLVREGLL